MAAQKVNQPVVKRASLKRVAKRHKMLGGDAGFISRRITNRIRVSQ